MLDRDWKNGMHFLGCCIRPPADTACQDAICQRRPGHPQPRQGRAECLSFRGSKTLDCCCRWIENWTENWSKKPRTRPSAVQPSFRQLQPPVFSSSASRCSAPIARCILQFTKRGATEEPRQPFRISALPGSALNLLTGHFSPL
jgi:hypothetical protein